MTQYRKAPSPTRNYMVNQAVAERVGLEAALIYSYFKESINNSYDHNLVFYEDKKWISDSFADLCFALNFLTETKIKKALKKLVDEGFLFCQKFSFKEDPEALWFAIEPIRITYPFSDK